MNADLPDIDKRISFSGFPRWQSVQSWIEVLRQEASGDVWRVLRMLLPMVEASMSAGDRLVLHRTLWSVWREANEPLQQQASTLLDGRYRMLCEWMALDWSHGLTQRRLIAAHLQRQFGLPHDPDYVLELLDQPEARQSMTGSLHGWWSCQAHLRREPWALSPLLAEPWLASVTEAVVQGEVTWSAGMGTMFEILVRVGQPDSAMEILADCVLAGCADAISTDALCSWLEGEHPLRLVGGLQSGWLKAGSDIARAAWRARLKASVHRDELVDRLGRLEHTLVARGASCEGGLPEHENDSWRLLSMLDKCYALAQQHRLPQQALDLLMDHGQLAPVSVSGLWRAFAHQCMHTAHPVAALSALAKARLFQPDPDLRRNLAQLLDIFCDEIPSDAVPAARQIITQLEQGSCGGAHSPEAQSWRALDSILSDLHWLKSPVSAMCARLATEGGLEFSAADRQRDLPMAKMIWESLKEDKVHAGEAHRNLRSEPLQDWLPWLQRSSGMRDHLWIEPRERGSANNELLIVMSCLESRHGFAHFKALREGLKDRHLLFINNPEFDWYSGETFDDLVRLMHERVFPKFRSDKVSCYFGSMGGHGALALARHFGFRAITFNAQVDLDLWAAFRPAERTRLWTASDRGASQRLMQVWPRATLCLMTGSGTADREALSALIDGLAACQHGNFIIMKFPDPIHAGLIARVVHGSLPQFLARMVHRLVRLERTDIPQVEEVEEQLLTPVECAHALWRQVAECDRLQTEIIIRNGGIFSGPLR